MMKMHTGKHACRLLLALALVLSLCTPVSLAEGAAPVRLADDFYTHVNAAWLDSTEIRADRASVSAFSEAEDRILETLMADFEAMLASQERTGDDLLDMFLTYYGMARDADGRNADGFAPAAADYARIESLQSLDDVTAQAKAWMLDGMPLPFGLSVSTNMLDVTVYGLDAGMASSFLTDPSYYEADNQIGQILLPLLKDMQAQLLIAVGETEDAALAIVEQAFAFDALLAAKMPTVEAQNDYTTFINPMPMDGFAATIESIDMIALAESLIGTRPEEINVTNVAFFDSFDEIYAPEQFDNMKSWMKVNFLMGVQGLLSEDISAPMQIFEMLISGAQALADPAETAYSNATSLFGEVVGRYYGETYFGEEARADVTEIVQQAIDVYRTRLEGNAWLGEETKAMAVQKLDAMSIRIGYPDALPAYYSLYEITPAEEGGTLYGNTMSIVKAIIADQYGKYGTAPDRSEWITTGDTVNAFYSPVDNSINFPAGILQAPMYSPDQSEGANLGGIGMVIGHEISHAFDSNGALFDEVGNLRNWWTEADFAEFEARSAAMVALFDGIPYADGEVNGLLTLGENTADAGGISCMLDIVRSSPEVSLSDFFEAYAAIWRNKTTPEMEALNLSDPHSPPILRVNIQCGNCDAFYEAYDIEETDAMYIAPEDRVAIW